MGSKKKQVIGIRYFMGMHLVICHSAGAITEIQVGDRTAWSGFAGTETIFINNRNLFGGDKKEGGVYGYVDVLRGDPSQGRNPYLQRFLGVEIPSFRGVVSLVLNQVQFTANNPYAKPWAVRVRRNATIGTAAGQAADPSEIIRECLTDRVWGMGYSNSMIDTDTFNYASQVLSCEGFGLNLLWTRQQPIEDFIRVVLDHIMAILYRNTTTGQFALRLIRGDYDPALTPIFDTNSAIVVESFERVGYGETVNEVTVVYTNRDNWTPRSVTEHNLANIAIQGGVVSRKTEYPGICNAELASRVAQRDLRAASVPLAKIRLKADRRSWLIEPGGLFRLSYPELQVEGVIFRVITVDYGTLDNGEITIEAIEDVFSLGTQGSIGENNEDTSGPDLEPIQPSFAVGFELSYWDVSRTQSRADLSFIEDTDTYIGAIAVAGNVNQQEWEVATGPDLAGSLSRSSETYAPSVIIQGGIPQSVSNIVNIPYVNPNAEEEIVEGDYAYLFDLTQANNNWDEAVLITDVDTVLGTISFARGVIDSIPKELTGDIRLVMAEDFIAPEDIIRAPSEVVHVYTIPVTSSGVGSLYATNNGPALTLTGRQGRPYPPGNFRIDGKNWGETFMGDLDVTWNNRNKKLQTGFVVVQSDPSITLDPGTTHTIEVTGEDGSTIIATLTGIVLDNRTYLAADEAIDSALPGGRVNNSLIVKLFSTQNSIDSLQTHEALVYRADYGYNYGHYYGGAL